MSAAGIRRVADGKVLAKASDVRRRLDPLRAKNVLARRERRLP
jgi:hypothetical protein